MSWNRSVYVLLCLCTIAFKVTAVSIHAIVLNQRPDESAVGINSSQLHGNGPPMKISTSRMKPVTSPASPRYQNALRDVNDAFRHTLKGVSHVAILPDHTSKYLLPKVSVKPGRQDSNVISFFHHPAEYPKAAGPYQYMQHQQADEATDFHAPAKTYMVGQQKSKSNSQEALHTANIINGLSGGDWRHPKAALAHSLPGDARAGSKRPTVTVNPGRLYGNLVTAVYGPETPKSSSRGKGKGRQGDQSSPPDEGPSQKRSRAL